MYRQFSTVSQQQNLSRIKNLQGFTMLEMLVVISIIAISMGLIAVSINPTDYRKDLAKEAINFEQALKLIVDEAIFKHKEIGLKIYDDHIEFLNFNVSTQTWEAFSQESEDAVNYADYKFSDFLDVRLEMEDAEIFLNPKDEFESKLSSINPLDEFDELGEEEELIEPDVYIFSSGEITAFDLEFRLKDNDDFVYIISANDIGVVTCKALHQEEELCR